MNATKLFRIFPALAGLCCTASAAVIFETGFEPPAYPLGPLNGIDSWAANAPTTFPVIQNGTVRTGAQAVRYDASLATSQHVSYRSVTYSATGNPSSLVRMRSDVFLSTSGTKSIWDAIYVFGGGLFLGQIFIYANDTAGLGLASSAVGAVPVSRGAWNTYELVLNFASHTITATVNGQFIGQGAFPSSVNQVNLVGLGVNTAPGTDQAFFDNVSVNTDAPLCPTPMLTRTSASFSSSGGMGTAAVQSSFGCSYTATSPVPWITINNSPAEFPTPIQFTVAPNTSPSSRSATLTIAGSPFIVFQGGAANNVSCAVTAPAPTTARVEGKTELLGDITFTCSGSAQTPVTADLTLQLNATVTSALIDSLTNTTEALLLVGNPSAPQLGANAFFGVTAGYTQLRWTGVSLLPAGSSVSRAFRITNVRADATIAASITGTLSVQSATPVGITAGQQVSLGLIQSGMQFTRSDPTPGPNPATQTIVPVRFTEGFTGAFKPKQAAGQDPGTPGTIYNSESGYVYTSQLGRAGQANTGTRLRVKLTGVPANVTVSASVISDNGRAQLISADANGKGGSPVPGVNGYGTIAVSNGTAVATWEITSSDPAAIESPGFNLLFGNATAATLAPVQIGATLAALSGVSVSSATEPVPRFRDLSVPQNLVTLGVTSSIVTPGASPAGKVVPLSGAVRYAVSAGSNITFLNQIENDGSSAASNVKVVNNLPSTLLLTSCVASAGSSCTATPSGITLEKPSLGAGQTASATVVAQVRPDVPAGTVIEDIIGGLSDDPPATTDTSSASSSFIVGGCGYALTRGGYSAAAAGDIGRVDVVTGAGCPWSAVSSIDWITVASGSGPGPGAVRYQLSENTTNLQRSGVVTIADLPFTVVQAAAGCSISATVPNTTIGPGGGSFNLSVTAGAGCSWNTSAAPDWMSLPVTSGTGNGTVTVNVAQNFSPSPRTGSLTVAGSAIQIVQQRSNTPPPVALFQDVPLTHPYSDQVTLLRQNNITTGCTDVNYCPDATTTRGQMAVFIIRALLGGDTFTFQSTPSFTDVPASHPYFKYIQKMKELGITSGCTATMYCADDPVTRGQMAVFLIRARLGIMPGAAFPAPSAPYFTDVPAAHQYFSFIQKMRQLGITSGCTATQYCPDAVNTRGQMAVFLIRAFFTP